MMKHKKTQDNEPEEEKDLSKTDDQPGMSNEETENACLNLLMMLAQVYYKMLECTVSLADWGGVLDLELNQSYLWTVKSIGALLKNVKALSDFPVSFEPAFSDLYPSTIEYSDWESEVRPHAEKFLSTVQKYVFSKGRYDPEEKSDAWVFIELHRSSIEDAVKQAVAYNERVREHCQKIFGNIDKSPMQEILSGQMKSTNDPPRSDSAPDPENEREKMLIQKEVAEILTAREPLGLDIRAAQTRVNRACKNGKLKCSGEGKYCRIPESAALVWIENQKPKQNKDTYDNGDDDDYFSIKS